MPGDPRLVEAMLLAFVASSREKGFSGCPNERAGVEAAIAAMFEGEVFEAAARRLAIRAERPMTWARAALRHAWGSE